MSMEHWWNNTERGDKKCVLFRYDVVHHKAHISCLGSEHRSPSWEAVFQINCYLNIVHVCMCGRVCVCVYVCQGALISVTSGTAKYKTYFLLFLIPNNSHSFETGAMILMNTEVGVCVVLGVAGRWRKHRWINAHHPCHYNLLFLSLPTPRSHLLCHSARLATSSVRCHSSPGSEG